MASNFRPDLKAVPTEPGVYRFSDADGRVIYVGKAKSLRSRLSSYFQDFAGLHPRTQAMVSTAADVDWTVVGTEVEALQLEYSWIKEYEPRFNVRYRDDKSYPYLAVSLGEEHPRIQVMRGTRRKGVRYFGPYSHAWAIRETVDLLLRVFPVRTCSTGVFNRARSSGRPCLLGYIDKCTAPCVGRITAEEHRRLAEDFCSFMAGDTGRFLRGLEEQMRRAAAEQQYEQAARVRDDIQALRTAMEKQAVVLSDSTDCDVIALAEEAMEAAVQVFYVRGGRVRGRRGWVVDRVEERDTAGLVEQFLTRLYGELADAARAAETAGEAAPVPREVLVPCLPPDPEAVTAWLSGIRGSQVTLRVPRRGDKKSLLETVTANARHALDRHRAQRAGDLTTRSRALSEIADALELDQAPLRIECYDVSNLQGDHVVASMVVFEDGLARTSQYRRFSIRGTGTASGPEQAGGEAEAARGDTAALHEVVKRRFTRYLEESRRSGELSTVAAQSGQEAAAEPTGEEGPAGRTPDSEAGRARFAYPPNLVVVDGGRPQVHAARRALDELGIDDVAVCGLAKRLEEVWLPGDADPVILPRTSEGLYLLQRVRDEAHRFAIGYHRKKRSGAMTASALDGVPGVGPSRRAALLRHFGSLRRLKTADLDQIAAVPGIGRRTAEAIRSALGESGAGARSDGHTSNESGKNEG